jgi:hypothetical protein
MWSKCFPKITSVMHAASSRRGAAVKRQTWARAAGEGARMAMWDPRGFGATGPPPAVCAIALAACKTDEFASAVCETGSRDVAWQLACAVWTSITTCAAACRGTGVSRGRPSTYPGRVVASGIA